MSMFPQPAPILFNIENEIQEKMVMKVLDKKSGFGFTDKHIEEMWEATQDYFIKRGVHNYNKIYRKYKAGKQAALRHYKKKIQKDIGDSGSQGAPLKKFLLGGDKEKDLERLIPTGGYGLIQIITNYYLYKEKNNPYYEWALYPLLSQGQDTLNIGQEREKYYRPASGSASRTLLQKKNDIAKYNEKFRIDSRAGLIEASLNITKQCEESCGAKPKINDKIKCYICGKEIQNESGVDAAGSQCEHVVPVTALAALCGLSGKDYDKTIESYWERNKQGIGTNDYYISEGWAIPKETYTLWRKNLLGDKTKGGNLAKDHGGGDKMTGVMYRWSHPGCNMIKKDHAFLALDWTPAATDEEWDELTKRGFPVLDEKEYCDEQGIKYVLERMADIVKGGGGSHSKAWRAKFTDFTQQSDVQRQGWVEDRLSAMKNNTMKWAKQVIFSQDINGVFSPQYKGFKSGGTGIGSAAATEVVQEDWPSFRTALCNLSMNILDFRVEEKVIAHYEKLTPSQQANISLKNDTDRAVFLGEWRKSEWSDLVGISGGAPPMRRRTSAQQEDEFQRELQREEGYNPYKGIRTRGVEPYGARKILKKERLRNKLKAKALEKRLSYELDEFKLAVYFDVLDSTTPEEDRVCLARNRAREYIENSENYIDRDEVKNWSGKGPPGSYRSDSWYHQQVIQLTVKLNDQLDEMKADEALRLSKKDARERSPTGTKEENDRVRSPRESSPTGTKEENDRIRSPKSTGAAQRRAATTKRKKKKKKPRIPVKTKGKRGAIGKMTRAKPVQSKKPGRKPLRSKKTG